MITIVETTVMSVNRAHYYNNIIERGNNIISVSFINYFSAGNERQTATPFVDIFYHVEQIIELYRIYAYAKIFFNMPICACTLC